MDLNNWTLVAAAGSLVAFWHQIKSMVVRTLALVIRTDEIRDSSLAVKFLQEILPSTKLIRWGNVVYLSEGMHFPAQKAMGRSLLESKFLCGILRRGANRNA